MSNPRGDLSGLFMAIERNMGDASEFFEYTNINLHMSDVIWPIPINFERPFFVDVKMANEAVYIFGKKKEAMNKYL